MYGCCDDFVNVSAYGKKKHDEGQQQAQSFPQNRLFYA
jgi:hypothetical protein